MQAVVIRPLADEDAEAYAELRRASLHDAPLAFTASPEDDFVSSEERVREHLSRAPEAVILGAFADRLVGFVGVARERHVKTRHRVYIWGMYVAPSHRGQALGARLIEAAITHARSLPGVEWVHLSVSSAATAARRMYERAGFESWGSEPDALRHEGRSVSENHMALRLR